MLKDWLLPRLAYWIYRLWSATWRVRRINLDRIQKILDDRAPFIFAHWHRDELALVQFVPVYRIATMTSTSKDGQLIDFVIRKLGGATAKGSSTRGGAAALKGLTRLVEAGYRASMAVDGPKGPIFQVKPGVFELSRLTQAWIIPVGVASAPHFVFKKSWNKARLPLPFARIMIFFGEPLRMQEEGNAKDTSYRDRLTEQLQRACQQAQGYLGSTSS